MAHAREPRHRRQEKRKRLACQGLPCAICGKPIDYSLSWWVDPSDGKRKRHPLSFEMDHRQSLATGGTNDFENMQPAHRICNQKAGAKRTPSKGTAPNATPNSRAW